MHTDGWWTPPPDHRAVAGWCQRVPVRMCLQGRNTSTIEWRFNGTLIPQGSPGERKLNVLPHQIGNQVDLTLMVVLVIVLALFFDFTNGFHDTANAMATPIATGALKPRTAVLLASILNLVGAFLSTEVAKTISGGIIREDQITSDLFPAIIFAGLIGAITWNMVTW